MEHILTQHVSMSNHCKDGKDRNYVTYFLNGIKILKQKVSFNTNYEQGFDKLTSIYGEYILNNKLYQTRYNSHTKKERNVSFPLSKKTLKNFGDIKDIKIKKICLK